MNKDAMRQMALEARIHLQISDNQVKMEMQKCKQHYFNPNEFETIDPALKVMLNCLKCECCERIPLELQECAHCASIVCKHCEALIKNVNGDTPEEEQCCPDPDCEGTLNGELFDVAEFSSKMMLKQLKDNTIMHSCKRSKTDADGNPIEDNAKAYTVAELFDHILNVCLKKENICPNCQVEHESIEESWMHLKKDCDNVRIECDMCDQRMTRGEFKQHPCYERCEIFREVIANQEKAANDVNNTGKQLRSELEWVQSMKSKQAEQFEARKRELKARLDHQQQMKNAQFLRTNDFKVDHEIRKQRYIESSLATPFFSQRYKINLNTCFECSHDQLVSDILDHERLTAPGQIYFEMTKRMTEFSKKRGFDGVGKFCGYCSRECTYINDYESGSAQPAEQDFGSSAIMDPFGHRDAWQKRNQPAQGPKGIATQGLYFECRGDNGCGRVICDICQQIAVMNFENRPQLLIHKISLERELERIFEHLDGEALKKLSGLNWNMDQPQNAAVVEGGEVFDDAIGAEGHNEEQKKSERKRGKEMGLISDHFADAVADQGTYGAAETPQPEESGYGLSGIVRSLVGSSKPNQQARGRQSMTNQRQPRTQSAGVAPQMFNRGRSGIGQGIDQLRGREVGAAEQAAAPRKRESSLTGLNLRSGLYSLLGYGENEESKNNGNQQMPQFDDPEAYQPHPAFVSRIPRVDGAQVASGGAVGIAGQIAMRNLKNQNAGPNSYQTPTNQRRPLSRQPSGNVQAPVAPFNSGM